MHSRPHFSRLYHAGPTSREHELSPDATSARPQARFFSTLLPDDDDASRASAIASAFRGAFRRFEGHRDPALEAKDDCHPASSHEEDTRPPPARFTATADDSSTSSEETIIFSSPHFITQPPSNPSRISEHILDARYQTSNPPKESPCSETGPIDRRWQPPPRPQAKDD